MKGQRRENRIPSNGDIHKNRCTFMQESAEERRAPGHLICESHNNGSKTLGGGAGP